MICALIYGHRVKIVYARRTVRYRVIDRTILTPMDRNYHWSLRVLLERIKSLLSFRNYVVIVLYHYTCIYYTYYIMHDFTFRADAAIIGFPPSL